MIEISTSENNIILNNSITIYKGNPDLINIANKFPSIQIEKGFVKVPKYKQIKILLKYNWEEKILKIARIYLIGVQSRKVIDMTFNKLYN